MKNVIKTSKFISVTLDDGTLLVNSNPTKEFFQQIMQAETDEVIYALFNPEIEKDPHYKEPTKEVKGLQNGTFQSKYVVLNGNTAKIPSISELSVPQDFVEAILKAENEGNEELLTSYLNFWTLVSLNPDARVRKNIFWFITKWDVKITHSGLIVAYRNADFKKEGHFAKEFVERVTNDYVKVKAQKQSPKHYYYVGEEGTPVSDLVLVNSKKHPEQITDDNKFMDENLDELYILVTKREDTNVYTDHHSHTFDIRIGTPVSMPREQCDASEQTCSRGLHCASRGWLQENYYGDTGLVVLVNPANIVNCPPLDSYGKMRCCEYLPIGVATYGEDGKIQEVVDSAFEDGYILDYAGKINNEDLDNFTIYSLRAEGIDRDNILKRVQDIAAHTERYVE